MTRDEFDDVWVEFFEAFPQVGAWLEKSYQRDEPGESAKLAKSQKERWWRALAEVDVEDAKEAIDKMFSDEENRPRGFGDYASRLFSLARTSCRRRERKTGGRVQPLFVDGERAVACRHCEDHGMVIVYQPATVQECVDWRPREPLPYLYTAGMVCFCRAGDQFDRRRQRTRFTLGQDVRDDPLADVADEVERIRDTRSTN